MKSPLSFSMRYNSSLRSNRNIRQSSNRSFSIFMPFVILICIGLIGVLGYKLYDSLVDKEPEKGVKIEIISGKVEMKAWGTEQFVSIVSDSFLMEGDEITSSDDSLIVLDFPEGSLLRANAGVDLVLDQLDLEKIPNKIKTLLVHGDIWLNKVLKPMGKNEFVVSLGYVNVRVNDLSIVSLENKIDEIVRVVSGATVFVDILDEQKIKVVETVSVGVGQEARFSKEVLAKYWNYESPSILVPLSDEFRNSDWYTYNMTSDRGESSTMEISELDDFEDISTSEVSDSSETLENLKPLDSSVPKVEQSSTLTTPTISTVAGGNKTDEKGFYVVTNHLATLVGTAPGASAVYVNEYRLQQFKPNDATWTYFANAKYNLMKEGENTYNIYSVDSSGKKSATFTVKVLYKPAVVTPAPVTTPQVSDTPPAVVSPPVETTPPEDHSQMPDWLL